VPNSEQNNKLLFLEWLKAYKFLSGHAKHTHTHSIFLISSLSMAPIVGASLPVMPTSAKSLTLWCQN